MMGIDTKLMQWITQIGDIFILGIIMGIVLFTL